MPGKSAMGGSIKAKFGKNHYDGINAAARISPAAFHFHKSIWNDLAGKSPSPIFGREHFLPFMQAEGVDTKPVERHRGSVHAQILSGVGTPAHLSSVLAHHEKAAGLWDMLKNVGGFVSRNGTKAVKWVKNAWSRGKILAEKASQVGKAVAGHSKAIKDISHTALNALEATKLIGEGRGQHYTKKVHDTVDKFERGRQAFEKHRANIVKTGDRILNINQDDGMPGKTTKAGSLYARGGSLVLRGGSLVL